MTIIEAKQAGIEHAAAGKKLTPFDCQSFDRKIYAAMKNAEKPAKFYTSMRGAFNRGWQQKYFEMVGGDSI